MKPSLILAVALIVFLLPTGCNQDLNQSQKVKIIEEKDPIVKILEERDSIVIIDRKSDKKN
jgi:hypothetical protein